MRKLPVRQIAHFCAYKKRWRTFKAKVITWKDNIHKFYWCSLGDYTEISLEKLKKIFLTYHGSYIPGGSYIQNKRVSKDIIFTSVGKSCIYVSPKVIAKLAILQLKGVKKIT